MYKSLKYFFFLSSIRCYFLRTYFFFFVGEGFFFFSFLLMCFSVFLFLYYYYSFIFFKRFVASSFGYYFVSLLNLSWNYLRMHMTIRTYFFCVITWKLEGKKPGQCLNRSGVFGTSFACLVIRMTWRESSSQRYITSVDICVIMC